MLRNFAAVVKCVLQMRSV